MLIVIQKRPGKFGHPQGMPADVYTATRVVYTPGCEKAARQIARGAFELRGVIPELVADALPSEAQWEGALKIYTDRGGRVKQIGD